MFAFPPIPPFFFLPLKITCKHPPPGILSSERQYLIFSVFQAFSFFFFRLPPPLRCEGRRITGGPVMVFSASFSLGFPPRHSRLPRVPVPHNPFPNSFPPHTPHSGGCCGRDRFSASDRAALPSPRFFVKCFLFSFRLRVLSGLPFFSPPSDLFFYRPHGT